MNKYNLIGENNFPITIGNFQETNIKIKNIFPEVEKKDMGRTIRGTYSLWEGIFHIYYGSKDSQAFIPKNQEIIKNEFELKTKLKLENIN